jgi:hypothetical protein
LVDIIATRLDFVKRNKTCGEKRRNFYAEDTVFTEVTEKRGGLTLGPKGKRKADPPLCSG